jgi:AcrR family transcriptional regulator
MPVRPRKRIRAKDQTRQRLLGAAFAEVYRRGFQAASLDIILARAGVTKGALYHHFPDKAALGYAVLDQIVAGLLLERWLQPLSRLEPDTDPLAALQAVLRYRAAHITVHEITLGCPLNNLAQEMSPLDDRFRRRITRTFDAWRKGFARTLERARAAGTVRRDVDPGAVAGLLVAAIEGSIGLAKSARSRSLLRTNLETLASSLDALRPARAAPRTRGRRGRR